MTTGFPPIAAAGADTLVLGSLPSVRSVELGQYYGHARNAFWPIMGELVGARPELPYDERVRRLVASGIAVWDVLEKSRRPGSLDADIDMGKAAVNDFTGFFAAYPAIERVFFNGKKAAEIFASRCGTADWPGIRFGTLPSTSPAYAAMPFSEKLERWRVVTRKARS